MTRRGAARTAWRGAGFLWVVLGGMAVLAGGCRSGAAEQHRVEWNEERLLFVADDRNGWVRVFDLRSGLTPRDVLTANRRRAVLALALDVERGRLWVLGDDALYAYDAHGLAPRQRLALPANTGPGRRLELAADGTMRLLDAGTRRILFGVDTLLSNDGWERLSFHDGQPTGRGVSRAAADS